MTTLMRIWPLTKFCMVGVVNTAISYGVYLLLQRFWPYLAAHVAGWYVGVCASFLMNCLFTYRVRPTWRRFWMFPLSSLPNVLLSSAGVVALIEVAHVDQRLAPLVATLAAIPLSYLLAKAILAPKGATA